MWCGRGADSYWMTPDNGVNCLDCVPNQTCCTFGLCELSMTRVNALETIQNLLHFWRQLLIGLGHASKDRVTSRLGAGHMTEERGCNRVSYGALALKLQEEREAREHTSRRTYRCAS